MGKELREPSLEVWVIKEGIKSQEWVKFWPQKKLKKDKRKALIKNFKLEELGIWKVDP